MAEAALLGLGAGALLLLLLPAHADTDIWGHVRFGQELLASGVIPRTDPYSYLTGSARWMNHELLSEAAFAAVFGTLGGLGLVALKFAVVLGLALIGARRLLAAGCSRLRVLAMMLPAAVLALPRFGTVRPQMFTALGCGLLFVMLLRAERGSAKALWLMPFLIAAWVNTHGGVLLGVGLALLWAGVRAVEARRLGWRELTPIALGLVALLANPYGPALPVFLLRTATVARPDVAEWQPLRLASAQGLAYLTLLALLAHGAWRARMQVSWSRMALLLTVALLPLLATRHTDVFAVGALLLGAEFLAVPLGRAAEAHGPVTGPDRHQASRDDGAGARAPLTPPAKVLALALCAGMLLAGAPDRPGCIGVSPGVTTFPARAVGSLESAHVQANVAVPFAWGEYVIWKAYPRLRVSIDGRRETVYSPELRDAALRLESGRGDWAQLLRDPRTDLVLARSASPTANLLEENRGWTRVYEDEEAVVYARAGSLLAAPIPRPPGAAAIPADGRGQCFR